MKNICASCRAVNVKNIIKPIIIKNLNGYKN